MRLGICRKIEQVFIIFTFYKLNQNLNYLQLKQLQTSIVGDSINHFLSLFLYVNSLGFTDSLKIVNVSGFKATGI